MFLPVASIQSIKPNFLPDQSSYINKKSDDNTSTVNLNVFV